MKQRRFLLILLLMAFLSSLLPVWSASSSTSSRRTRSTVKQSHKKKKRRNTRTTKKRKTSKKSNSESSLSKEAQQQFIQGLRMLNEVWTRQVTLEYLGDTRTDTYLKRILQDFSKKLQKNFISNIRGDYKAEFFANYAAKMEDVENQIFEPAKNNIAYDGILGSVLKQAKFPMDLAFYGLARKFATRRKFQAVNAEGASAKTYKQLSDYWQAVVKKMRANRKKSRYEAVAAMYKNVAPRDFPIEWYDDAQNAVMFETTGAHPASPGRHMKKKWTFLVYICADNDLERFGLQDVNEMEQVGSTKEINLVVQLDRMRGGKGDSISDGNWVGTRRYFVKKDNNLRKISSKMVMNLGEKDMGDKRTLADFISWGVKTYPADHVAIVIWNHGAGWVGVAFDDQSDNHLRLEDVSWALREGQKTLSKVNKKASKFDIIDFDACLMGTLEVAYELSDYVKIMVASEETEPGQGMPYADYLAPLAKNPNLSAKEVAKRMVGTYVQSYSKGGSATSVYNQGSSVTKAAIDLAKVKKLVKDFDRLGKVLLDNNDFYAQMLVSESGRLASIRRYSDDTLVDLTDLAINLSQIPDIPSEMRTVCYDIVKDIGYPVANDRLARAVIVKSEKPGVVVWGYNGWRTPPRELWPPRTRIFRSRLALTPLTKASNGMYYCKIGPFKPVYDEALEKRVFVKEIDYQIIRKDGRALDKRKVKQGKEYLIVSRFPKNSPLIIEGHTQGMGDSRGLSIYYCPAYRFRTEYKTLKFAKDTCWDEFLEKIPEFKRNARVLLCGQMVQDPMTIPLVAKALKANKMDFQVLWDPSVFGYQFKDILRKFAKTGLVITDSVSASSMGQLSPSSDDLIDYLDHGGNLVIAAQSFEQSNIHRKLLKNYFRFTYVNDEKDFDELICKGRNGKELTLTLNGDESSRTAAEVTIMKTKAPGKLFVTMPDGRGAGIYVRTDKYSAIYLGFRFEAVGDTDTRNKFMGMILDKVYPQHRQLSLF